MTQTHPITAKNKTPLIVILLVMLSLIAVAADKLVIVMTPSVTPTVLWKLDGQAHSGEYVTFEFQHNFIGPQPFLMTKKIGCYQGEWLERRQGVHFYCNGNYLGAAKQVAIDGKDMPLFRWKNGVVPFGQVFVVGSHVDSFDSRYWGLVALGKLQRLQVVL